jgi:hypothetical protein
VVVIGGVPGSYTQVPGLYCTAISRLSILRWVAPGTMAMGGGEVRERDGTGVMYNMKRPCGHQKDS